MKVKGIFEDHIRQLQILGIRMKFGNICTEPPKKWQTFMLNLWWIFNILSMIFITMATVYFMVYHAMHISEFARCVATFTTFVDTIVKVINFRVQQRKFGIFMEIFVQLSGSWERFSGIEIVFDVLRF